jgi:hypothetical protein
MGMANGAYTPAVDTQPSGPPDSFDHMQSAVIKVNFGLTWKHIAALVLGVPGLVGSIGLSGWLVMPAKETDMQAVKVQVQSVETRLEGVSNQVRDVSIQMTTAIDELRKMAARPMPVPKKAPK